MIEFTLNGDAVRTDPGEQLPRLPDPAHGRRRATRQRSRQAARGGTRLSLVPKREHLLFATCYVTYFFLRRRHIILTFAFFLLHFLYVYQT